jgi:hypothetical protein
VPDDSHPDLTVTLALTVVDPRTAEPHDILARGRAEQRVADLARRLAMYFGHSPEVASTFTLRVERTGEQLRPEALISSVDLLDGDTLTLIPPRGTRRVTHEVSARRPRLE